MPIIRHDPCACVLEPNQLDGPDAVASLFHCRGDHRSSCGTNRLAGAGAGDLLRQCHCGRCRQDDRGAGPCSPAARAWPVAVHVLLRGYGGARARPAHRVLPADTAATTGDEALLFSAVAPTWTGSDRAASARAAVAAGSEALLMDDGLQNASLEKTISLLVIDGATGFGNGRVLPAGPLREPVAVAASRCRAAVLIGPDTSGVVAQLPTNLPVLRAHLEQSEEVAALVGHRVFAFAGIAIPDKIFAGLERAGIVLAERIAFPDHHNFTRRELARLTARAEALGAALVTTPKDAVRLPHGMAVHVVGVRLVWESEAEIDGLLDELGSGPALFPPARRGQSMA